MVPLSPSFTPAILRGIQVDPSEPFKFHFILDQGDAGLRGKGLKEESEKLVRYFLASLAIPENELWVNLSPYEKDRIVPDQLGKTAMGLDMLAQDYLLKQITASLMSPDNDLGKKFWDKIYRQAYEKFGATDVPVDTFHKVWIMPAKAVVYVHDDKAFVIESRLRVMLEEDYLALSRERETSNVKREALDASRDTLHASRNNLASSIVREVVIPELEREVNEGQNFAQLRQIYNSLILATWFKKKLKNAIVNKVYSDRKKVKGLEVARDQYLVSSQEKNQSLDTSDQIPDTRSDVDQIYQQYLSAFKKGVCDYIKVEYDQYTQKNIPRKYFSGGIAWNVAPMTEYVSTISASMVPAWVSSTTFSGSDLSELAIDLFPAMPNDTNSSGARSLSSTEDTMALSPGDTLPRGAIRNSLKFFLAASLALAFTSALQAQEPVNLSPDSVFKGADISSQYFRDMEALVNRKEYLLAISNINKTLQLCFEKQQIIDEATRLGITVDLPGPGYAENQELILDLQDMLFRIFPKEMKEQFGYDPLQGMPRQDKKADRLVKNKKYDAAIQELTKAIQFYQEFLDKFYGNTYYGLYHAEYQAFLNEIQSRIQSSQEKIIDLQDLKGREATEFFMRSDPVWRNANRLYEKGSKDLNVFYRDPETEASTKLRGFKRLFTAQTIVSKRIKQLEDEPGEDKHFSGDDRQKASEAYQDLLQMIRAARTMLEEQLGLPRPGTSRVGTERSDATSPPAGEFSSARELTTASSSVERDEVFFQDIKALVSGHPQAGIYRDQDLKMIAELIYGILHNSDYLHDYAQRFLRQEEMLSLIEGERENKELRARFDKTLERLSQTLKLTNAEIDKVKNDTLVLRNKKEFRFSKKERTTLKYIRQGKSAKQIYASIPSLRHFAHRLAVVVLRGSEPKGSLEPARLSGNKNLFFIGYEESSERIPQALVAETAHAILTSMVGPQTHVDYAVQEAFDTLCIQAQGFDPPHPIYPTVGKILRKKLKDITPEDIYHYQLTEEWNGKNDVRAGKEVTTRPKFIPYKVEAIQVSLGYAKRLLDDQDISEKPMGAEILKWDDGFIMHALGVVLAEDYARLSKTAAGAGQVIVGMIREKDRPWFSDYEAFSAEFKKRVSSSVAAPEEQEDSGKTSTNEKRTRQIRRSRIKEKIQAPPTEQDIEDFQKFLKEFLLKKDAYRLGFAGPQGFLASLKEPPRWGALPDFRLGIKLGFWDTAIHKWLEDPDAVISPQTAKQLVERFRIEGDLALELWRLCRGDGELTLSEIMDKWRKVIGDRSSIGMINYKEIFSDVFTDLLRFSGQSKIELARIWKVEPDMVTYWEKGTYAPMGPKTVFMIARSFVAAAKAREVALLLLGIAQERSADELMNEVRDPQKPLAIKDMVKILRLQKFQTMEEFWDSLPSWEGKVKGDFGKSQIYSLENERYYLKEERVAKAIADYAGFEDVQNKKDFIDMLLGRYCFYDPMALRNVNSTDQKSRHAAILKLLENQGRMTLDQAAEKLGIKPWVLYQHFVKPARIDPKKINAQALMKVLGVPSSDQWLFLSVFSERLEGRESVDVLEDVAEIQETLKKFYEKQEQPFFSQEVRDRKIQKIQDRKLKAFLAVLRDKKKNIAGVAFFSRAQYPVDEQGHIRFSRYKERTLENVYVVEFLELSKGANVFPALLSLAKKACDNGLSAGSKGRVVFDPGIFLHYRVDDIPMVDHLKAIGFKAPDRTLADREEESIRTGFVCFVLSPDDLEQATSSAIVNPLGEAKEEARRQIIDIMGRITETSSRQALRKAVEDLKAIGDYESPAQAVYNFTVNKAKGMDVHVLKDLADVAEKFVKEFLKEYQTWVLTAKPGEKFIVNFATGDTPWVSYRMLADILSTWGTARTQEFLRTIGVDVSQKPDMGRVEAFALDGLFAQKRGDYFSFPNILNNMFDQLEIPKDQRHFFYGDMVEENGQLREMTKPEFRALVLDMKERGNKMNDLLANTLSPSDAQYNFLKAITSQRDAMSQKLISLGGPHLVIWGAGPSYAGEGHMAFMEKGVRKDQGAFIGKAGHFIMAGHAKENGGYGNMLKGHYGFSTFGFKELLGRTNAKHIVLITAASKRNTTQKGIEEKNLNDVFDYPIQALQGERGVFLLAAGAEENLRGKRHFWHFELIDHWTPKMIRQFFTRLSDDVGKPLGELTEEDAARLTRAQKSWMESVPPLIDKIREHNLTTLKQKASWSTLRQRVIDDITTNAFAPGQDLVKRLGWRIDDKSKKIVLINPHFDDDYLALRALVRFLTLQGYDIEVFYTAAGTTAVDDRYVANILEHMKGWSQEKLAAIRQKTGEGIAQELIPVLEGQDLHTDPSDFDPWSHMGEKEKDLRAQELYLNVVQHLVARGSRESESLGEVIRFLEGTLLTKPRWGARDIEFITDIKTEIRTFENKTAMMSLGLTYDKIHSAMDSSWYTQEGGAEAPEVSDIERIKEILRDRKPDLIISNGEGFADYRAHSNTETTVITALFDLFGEGVLDRSRLKYLTYAGVWDRTKIDSPDIVSVVHDRVQLAELERKFRQHYPSQSPTPILDSGFAKPVFFSESVRLNGRLSRKELLNLVPGLKEKIPALSDDQGGVLNYRLLDLNDLETEKELKAKVRELEKVRPFLDRAGNVAMNGPAPLPDVFGEGGWVPLEVLGMFEDLPIAKTKVLKMFADYEAQEKRQKVASAVIVPTPDEAQVSVSMVDLFDKFLKKGGDQFFGEEGVLAYYKKQTKMSLEKLGAEFGVGSDTMSGWIKGLKKVRPNDENIRTFADNHNFGKKRKHELIRWARGNREKDLETITDTAEDKLHQKQALEAKGGTFDEKAYFSWLLNELIDYSGLSSRYLDELTGIAFQNLEDYKSAKTLPRFPSQAFDLARAFVVDERKTSRGKAVSLTQRKYYEVGLLLLGLLPLESMEEFLKNVNAADPQSRSNALKELRLRQGLTIPQMAVVAGVHKTMYGIYEKNGNFPEGGKANIKKIMTALEVPLAQEALFVKTFVFPTIAEKSSYDPVYSQEQYRDLFKRTLESYLARDTVRLTGREGFFFRLFSNGECTLEEHAEHLGIPFITLLHWTEGKTDLIAREEVTAKKMDQIAQRMELGRGLTGKFLKLLDEEFEERRIQGNLSSKETPGLPKGQQKPAVISSGVKGKKAGASKTGPAASYYDDVVWIPGSPDIFIDGRRPAQSIFGAGAASDKPSAAGRQMRDVADNRGSVSSSATAQKAVDTWQEALGKDPWLFYSFGDVPFIDWPTSDERAKDLERRQQEFLGLARQLSEAVPFEFDLIQRGPLRSFVIELLKNAYDAILAVGDKELYAGQAPAPYVPQIKFHIDIQDGSLIILIEDNGIGSWVDREKFTAHKKKKRDEGKAYYYLGGGGWGLKQMEYIKHLYRGDFTLSLHDHLGREFTEAKISIPLSQLVVKESMTPQQVRSFFEASRPVVKVLDSLKDLSSAEYQNLRTAVLGYFQGPEEEIQERMEWFLPYARLPVWQINEIVKEGLRKMPFGNPTNNFTLKEEQVDILREGARSLAQNNVERIVVTTYGAGEFLPKGTLQNGGPTELEDALGAIIREYDAHGTVADVTLVVYDYDTSFLRNYRLQIAQLIGFFEREHPAWQGHIHYRLHYGNLLKGEKSNVDMRRVMATPSHITFWRNTWVGDQNYNHQYLSYADMVTFAERLKAQIDQGVLVVREKTEQGWLRIEEVVRVSSPTEKSGGDRGSAEERRISKINYDLISGKELLGSPQDVTRMSELIEQNPGVFDPENDPDMMRYHLKFDTTKVVLARDADQPGQIIGFLLAEKAQDTEVLSRTTLAIDVKKTASLHFFVVERGSRGQGVGRELLEKMFTASLQNYDYLVIRPSLYAMKPLKEALVRLGSSHEITSIQDEDLKSYHDRVRYDKVVIDLREIREKQEIAGDRASATQPGGAMTGDFAFDQSKVDALTAKIRKRALNTYGEEKYFHKRILPDLQEIFSSGSPFYPHADKLYQKLVSLASKDYFQFDWVVFELRERVGKKERLSAQELGLLIDSILKRTPVVLDEPAPYGPAYYGEGPNDELYVWYSGLSRSIIDYFKSRGAFWKEKDILEIAPGQDGKIIQWFKGQGANIMASDKSFRGTRLARQDYGIDAQRADVLDLSALGPKQFDAVIGCSVLRYALKDVMDEWSAEKADQAIESLKSVLVPGGLLVLGFYYSQEADDQIHDHRMPFAIRQRFQRSGFNLLAIEDFGQILVFERQGESAGEPASPAGDGVAGDSTELGRTSLPQGGADLAPGMDGKQTDVKTGGIDFNAQNMNIEARGSSDVQFHLPASMTMESLNSIQGLVPVVISITPVTNIWAVMGLNREDYEKTRQVQQPADYDRPRELSYKK